MSELHQRRTAGLPAVCRRVDLHPAPTAAESRQFGVTIERCVACGTEIYVSLVIRERTEAWHCDRCAPPGVRETLRELGVRGV